MGQSSIRKSRLAREGHAPATTTSWHIACSSGRQMMTRRPLLVAVLLASTLVSREVCAQERRGNTAPEGQSEASEPGSVWDRRLSLYGQLAPTGGPFGVVGASVDYAAARFLSFELGVGVGAGSPRSDFGVQAALMGHLKPIRSDNWALTVGAGPSVGNYGTTDRKSVV